jgi:plasmid replication initiation protein
MNNVDSERNINGNNLVTKSNKLIGAAYNLSEVEQKIITVLISLVNPIADTQLRSFTFAIKDFTKVIGVKSEKRNRELEELTKRLMSKIHEIRFEDGIEQVQWLTYAKYNYKEGTITLTLNEFLEPYLLDLKREFTSYELKNVSTLKGQYTIRIYELLRQYYNMKNKERTFLLDELRERLGAVDIYPAYANFKQRVLVPAQRQINQKSDITFEVEEIKKGRSVHRIKFIIHPKDTVIQPIPLPIKNNERYKDEEENNSEVIDVEEVAEDLFTVVEEEDIKEIYRLGLELGIQIPKKTIKDWLPFGKENIITIMDSIRGQKSLNNPIGFIFYKLKQALSEEEEFVQLNSDEEAIQELINSEMPEKHIRFSDIRMRPVSMFEESAIQIFSKHMSLDKAKEFWNTQQKEIVDKIKKQAEKLGY